MVKVNRALVSVYDKKGLEVFIRGLARLGVKILASDGTCQYLKECGLEALSISDYTGFEGMPRGQVKTLHPKVHAGILALRNNRIDLDWIREKQIDLFDMVVVNFYPFVKTARKSGVSLKKALSMIDIGGPALLRAAAKNYPHVIPVCDPRDYSPLLNEMDENGGGVSLATREKLARKAFQLTRQYDGAITDFLGRKDEERLFPDFISLNLIKVCDLRYGENPHQKAAFYRYDYREGFCLADMEQLHGKELSFNNLLDVDQALVISHRFDDPTAVIIKHTNPCGVGIGPSLAEAYERAYSTDPQSAFGSIIGFNRPVDGGVAEALSHLFVEVVVAPNFDSEALTILKRKKNVRLLCFKKGYRPAEKCDFRRVTGGALWQQIDSGFHDPDQWTVVSERKPSPYQVRAMGFGFRVVSHVKSNAVVLTTDVGTLGIGAGQMSRVDAVEGAIRKAQKTGFTLRGAIMASDAFFPFRDSIDLAAEAGISAVIQPGGSIRDKEVIQAADDRNMAMVFTGTRHFRH